MHQQSEDILSRIFEELPHFLPGCYGYKICVFWFGVALLIIQKLVVFFLKDLVAAIAKMVFHDPEEVQLSFKTTSAFIFRVMQGSFAIELNDVTEEVRVSIKEVFVPILVEENVSSCASQERV